MNAAGILSKVEEASGTSLYMKKKEAAHATIRKKENKLQEIDEILQKEIEPRRQNI